MTFRAGEDYNRSGEGYNFGLEEGLTEGSGEGLEEAAGGHFLVEVSDIPADLPAGECACIPYLFYVCYFYMQKLAPFFMKFSLI